MDYFPGGDLRYAICKRDDFTEQETKFISTCILLSINYLHDKGIIHRDLKPERLLFDSKGYLHLIGFCLSIECKKGETITNVSGTPHYMAPEAIINKPHDFMVDYYALGVILYELTMGERPYKGSNRKELKEDLFSHEINLTDDDIPEGWDTSIADLINRLLQRKKKKRLGNNGIDEIKSHPWFKDVQWEKTENFTFNPPFVIDSEDNFDKSFVEKYVSKGKLDHEDTMELTSIYRVPFVRLSDGVAMPKYGYSFMVTETADINLEKNKIESYTKKVEYLTSRHYEDTINMINNR
jgi:serine/threonine kinase 32